MLDLIKATKAALQASATLGYTRDNDIFITENIRLVRAAGEYPAIGIKDDGTGFSFMASNQEEDTLGLVVVVYAKLLKPEQAVTGGVLGQPGVLEMAQDVVTVLKDNTLGGQVETALPVKAGASEILVSKKLSIQMLPIHFKYTREV